MAAIASTDLTDRLPIGNRVLKTLQLSAATGAASATEWVVSGLSQIDAVVGAVLDGTAAADTGEFTFVLNAQGTGVAANTNPGDLGVETLLATTGLVVTIIGIP
jgi:hypothetical protein